MVDENGEPKRLDKGYSWEYPLSSHGLMHMAIHNAWAGDPQEIDVLFMYMANMGWNSSMNVPATHHYLTDKKPDGSYKIPKLIYSDAYHSETVAYADLVLPDTTYLERWDCISMLDRPISTAHGAADSIRQPVVALDRDVRPFQDVLLTLGERLKLPGIVDEDGAAKYPEGYKDYMVNHERTPGIGPLAGWRNKDGSGQGTGEVNPDQLQRYIDNGSFWHHEFEPEQQYYKHANRSYLEYAHKMGWKGDSKPVVMQIYSEQMQKFRLAAEGFGDVQPPDELRGRVKEFFDPLPIWYAPLEEEGLDKPSYPLHAVTQRPMHMYHSWGSQNAWLRQITARNRLYIHSDTAAELDIADDDWIWVISPYAKVKGQAKLMRGVNKNTVWTWNAIGKRKGAWGLSEDAPEATKGFLLNHVISELLPAREDGYRYSNSDPVTGQAAWYDLRVRIEKCAPAESGETEPMFAPIAPLPSGRKSPAISRYGAEFSSPPAMKPVLRCREWIGNRAENADGDSGIADGHGNRYTKKKKEGKS